MINVRSAAPLVSGVALAAVVGAGATAELGAMRISEEIDALEVMGIKSISYLVSTRIMAGFVVIIPLYAMAMILSFLSGQVTTTLFYGQSTGTYQHYFSTFLRPEAPSSQLVVVVVLCIGGFIALLPNAIRQIAIEFRRLRAVARRGREDLKEVTSEI